MGQQLQGQGAAGSSGSMSMPGTSQPKMTGMPLGSGDSMQNTMPGTVSPAASTSMWDTMKSDQFRKQLMDFGQAMSGQGQQGGQQGNNGQMMQQALQQQLANAQKKGSSGGGLLDALKGVM